MIYIKGETLDITEAIEYNERESKVVYFNLPCAPDQTTLKWTNYTQEYRLRCQAVGPSIPLT